jgi:hypothetical protein
MNANTKRRQRQIRREVISRHRESNGLPALKGGARIITVGAEKNCQMVVLHNVGEDGKKSSITRFLPFEEGKKQYRREFKPTHDRAIGRSE